MKFKMRARGLGLGMKYLDFEKEIQNSGSMLRWHPPTMAILDSPLRRLWHAACSATKLDEQAVSVVKLGPLRSKK